MIENNDLAPVLLFTYNRLEHTKQTIEYLKAQNNMLASIATQKEHLMMATALNVNQINGNIHYQILMRNLYI